MAEPLKPAEARALIEEARFLVKRGCDRPTSELLERIADALEATLPRPISEAPKDGTQIVTDAGIVAWSDPEGDGDGWYDAAGDWCGGICEPSVWAPLPQIHDPASKP